MYERPGRRRSLLTAVAALVDAARQLEPNRIPAPAVSANESHPASGAGTDPPRMPRRPGTSARTDRRIAHSEMGIDSSCAACRMNIKKTSSLQPHKM